MFDFIVIPISLVICLISQPIYFQKIVTIGRRSHRRGNCRHKKALAGRAGWGIGLNYPVCSKFNNGIVILRFKVGYLIII